MSTEKWSWNLYADCFFAKVREIFSITKDKNKKKLGLIVVVYFFCTIAILNFAPSASFVISFLSFFILSSLLYADRIVPLLKTFIYTLIQLPSFYLLSAFLNFTKTFAAEGNYALAFLCLFATYVAVLVNIFYCQLAFVLSFRPKIDGVNAALLEAFAVLTREFRIFLPLNLVATVIGAFLFSSTEMSIVVAYPIWTLLFKALAERLQLNAQTQATNF